MEVQRSAEEYLAMIGTKGLNLAPRMYLSLISGGADPTSVWPNGLVSVPQKREETLVNVVARKPLST